jgi:hypothetical protein
VRSRRISLITLVVSLGLHAALFAYLSSRKPKVAPPAVTRPIELEIVEAPRPAPKPPEPEKIEKAPPAPIASKKRKPTKAAVSSPVATETPAEEPSSAPIASDIPRLEPSAKPGPGVPVPSLRLDDADLISRMEPPPPAPARKGGLHAPAAPRSPQELVASTVQQTISNRRIESGNYPTYFSDLKKVLVIAWDIERVVNRRQQRGREMHQTRTMIRLVQDRTGYLVFAEIVVGSGDDEVDLEAIADLKRASKSLPRPPPDAVGDRESLASVWNFDYVPPPAIPPMEFDVISLVDPKAIPPRSAKKLSLVSLE